MDDSHDANEQRGGGMRDAIRTLFNTTRDMLAGVGLLGVCALAYWLTKTQFMVG